MSGNAAEIKVIYIYFYFLVGFYCREYFYVNYYKEMLGLINSYLTSRQYVGLFLFFMLPRWIHAICNINIHVGFIDYSSP